MAANGGVNLDDVVGVANEVHVVVAVNHSQTFHNQISTSLPGNVKDQVDWAAGPVRRRPRPAETTSLLACPTPPPA
jgi:hypothetical protein